MEQGVEEGRTTKRSHALITASLLALATACTPAGRSALPTAAGGKKPASAAPLQPGQSPTAEGTHTPLAPHSATLSGVVKLPPSLISDHGGGIISDNGAGVVSNNGGGVVSNNGAGYRLAALPTEQPVANLQVTLRDAAGKAVTGPDGQPLSATTDAAGRYAFTAPLPALNLIVGVTLPGDKGRLEAVAPRSSGPRVADATFVSTLTTTYILDQYVKGQVDPVVTFEKLPSDVEADTRLKATTALAGGSVAVPDALTPSQVVATVDQLRHANAPFDQQMETVKRLLIAAGQSDLGNGKPGTDVALGYVRAMTAAPDGTLMILSTYANQARLWKLAADGTLQAAGDLDISSYDAIGLIDRDAVQLAIDDDGVAYVLVSSVGYQTSGSGLYRFTAGTPTPLWQGTDRASLGHAAHGVLLLRPAASGATLWTYGTASEPAQLHTISAEAARLMSFAHPVARLANGMLRQTDNFAWVEVDAAGTKADILGASVDAPLSQIFIDADGTPYTLSAAGLTRHRADGQDETLLSVPPPGYDPEWGLRAMVAGLPNGDVFVAIGTTQMLYRVHGGQATWVAGANAGAGSGEVALVSPSGLAVGSHGDVIVSEQKRHRIIRVASDRTVTTLAGTGVEGTTGDGGPASSAQLSSPENVRLDGHGNLYFVEPSGDGMFKPTLRRVDAAGTLTRLYPAADRTYPFAPSILWDDLYTDAGDLYLSFFSDGSFGVWKLPATGAPTRIYTGSDRPVSLGQDAHGVLYALEKGKLLKQGADGRLTTLAEDLRFLSADPGGLAIDREGRVVITVADGSTVQRFDPAKATFTILAGAGGTRFHGSGIDDSLSGPCYPGFDADGNLLFLDKGHLQVKRIPVD